MVISIILRQIGIEKFNIRWTRVLRPAFLVNFSESRQVYFLLFSLCLDQLYPDKKLMSIKFFCWFLIFIKISRNSLSVHRFLTIVVPILPIISILWRFGSNFVGIVLRIILSLFVFRFAELSETYGKRYQKFLMFWFCFFL